MTPFTVVYIQENTNTEYVQFCSQLCADSSPPSVFQMMNWGLKFSLYVRKIQYNVSAEAGNSSWVLLVCLLACLLAYLLTN